MPNITNHNTFEALDRRMAPQAKRRALKLGSACVHAIIKNKAAGRNKGALQGRPLCIAFIRIGKWVAGNRESLQNAPAKMPFADEQIF
jgi:hypothetical protein